MNLSDLQRKHDFATDKGNSSHTYHGESYLDIYEKYFRRLKEASLVCEIGVLHGGSLRLWENYFDKAKVVGLDINPESAKHAGGRRTVETVHQGDLDSLRKAVSKHGQPDIIIDDGSHKCKHLITSFQTLWPLLKSGGLYVMEDLGITYHGVDGSWPGMHLAPTPDPEGTRDEFNAFLLQQIAWLDRRDSNPAPVRSIHMHSYLCVFEKV